MISSIPCWSSQILSLAASLILFNSSIELLISPFLFPEILFASFLNMPAFYVSIVSHLFMMTFTSFIDLIILKIFTVSLSCSITSSSWDAYRNFHSLICFFCCPSLMVNYVLKWFVMCFIVKSSSTGFFRSLDGSLFHSGMWQHCHRGFLRLLSRPRFYGLRNSYIMHVG